MVKSSQDIEISINKIKEINTNEYTSEDIENIFYIIYNHAKFKEQVQIIDFIFNDKKVIVKDLFNFVAKEWENIKFNRKDKFYYLIGKISQDVMFEDFKNMNNDIKNHILKEKIKFTDEEIKLMLTDCSVSTNTDTLKIYKEKYIIFKYEDVMEIAKKKNIRNENRSFLYEIAQLLVK